MTLTTTPAAEAFAAALAAGHDLYWWHRAIVLELCQAAGARSVTKSKSMVTEEIGLTAFLESHGMDPIETDLGEYILQISGQPPSHIVGPVVHMTKDEISDLFARHHGGPRLEETSALVAEARRILLGA